ncbi:DnaJ domain-containing protein [Clostridioides difficile]
MNYYKVLGIEESASQEEIRQAYDKQVKTFKEEVKDEKRLEKFLDLFKEAYDALNCEENIVQDQNEEIFDEEVSALFRNNNIKEKPEDKLVEKEIIKTESSKIENSYAATVLMSREEILRESLIQHHKLEEERIVFRSKEDFEDCDGFFDDEDEDFDEKIIRTIKQKKKAKNKKSSSKKKNNSAKKDNVSRNDKEYDSRDRDRGNNNSGKTRGNKKVTVKKEKASNGILDLLIIPLKVLSLPIIAILTILIFICRIISISSWLVAKVIIVGVIAISAIHGYQIYTGQAVSNYKIFIACGVGFIVSLFLPSIVRVVPNMLQRINNSLKKFVF